LGYCQGIFLLLTTGGLIGVSNQRCHAIESVTDLATRVTDAITDASALPSVDSCAMTMSWISCQVTQHNTSPMRDSACSRVKACRSAEAIVSARYIKTASAGCNRPCPCTRMGGLEPRINSSSGMRPEQSRRASVYSRASCFGWNELGRIRFTSTMAYTDVDSIRASGCTGIFFWWLVPLGMR